MIETIKKWFEKIEPRKLGIEDKIMVVSVSHLGNQIIIEFFK